MLFLSIRIYIMKKNALVLLAAIAMSSPAFAGGFVADDAAPVETSVAPTGEAAGVTTAGTTAAGTTAAVVVGGAAAVAAIALAASDSGNTNSTTTSTSTSTSVSSAQ